MRRARALALTVALLAAGCSADGAAHGRPTVTVFAASSLAGVLEQVRGEYSAADVRLSFAGSQSLVAQVQQGAPADLVVTADEASMAPLRGALDGAVVVLARNALAVVTDKGNPAAVTTLADLARPDVDVVLGGAAVPVGRAARAALDDAGLVVQPVSEEPDVKAVLGKVRLGEADAGVVYATDLLAAGDDVGGFALPGAVNAYPAGVVSGAEHAAAARDLLGFLVSDTGRRLFVRAGFLPP